MKVHEISDLQDESPGRFRAHGLRNLVRAIGKIARDAGGPEWVAINATGGYKAQIAVAVLIGQALGSPVFYKYDRFESEVIAFPPMPVSFDYDLLGAYANLFDALEKQNEQLSDEPPEAVRALLDEEVIDGVRCWALGAIGQIYLESYRQRFPPQRCLPRAASPDERRPPSFADHHYPAGFKDAVKRIFEEVAFLTGGHSLPYSKQTGIARRGFYFEDGGNEREKGIVFEMREKDFGARYLFFTTAANRSEWIAAAVELNRRFGERS